MSFQELLAGCRHEYEKIKTKEDDNKFTLIQRCKKCGKLTKQVV